MNTLTSIKTHPRLNSAPAGIWAHLLHALAESGDIVMITRQPAVVLAGARAYPKLAFTFDRNWVAVSDNSLGIDFTRWGRAQIIIESTGSRSFSVFDCDGENVHNVILPEELDSEWLETLARLALGASLQARIATNVSVPGAPWQTSRAVRAASLRESGSHSMPATMLTPLFHELGAANLSLLVSAFNDTVIQRHLCQFDDSGERDGWLWGGSSGAALRVLPAQIGEVWCVGGTCQQCSETHWALEAYDHAHRLAFSMQAAVPEQESHWRALLSRASAAV